MPRAIVSLIQDMMNNDNWTFKSAENTNLSELLSWKYSPKLEFHSKTKMNNTNNIAFHSVNSGIQKVALYETKTVITEHFPQHLFSGI